MPPEDELHESPLSPADDERIRRLLAEARHTEPIPTELATQLDGVLAELSADRARRDERDADEMAHARRTPVVDLAARRRRTATNLLVAAAAVVAIGVGISQVLPQVSGDDMGEATAPAADDGAVQGEQDAGGGMESESDSPPAAPSEVAAAKVRSKRFGADVRKLRASRTADALSAPQFYALNRGCLTNDVGAGEYVPATYDGASAVVVLRLPSGDVQVVDLYLCGDTEPRRSITLTLP